MSKLSGEKEDKEVIIDRRISFSFIIEVGNIRYVWR